MRSESDAPDRFHTVVKAVVSGLVVQAVGVLPFSFLMSANLRHGASVPWASAVEVVLLWVLCRYLYGRGWPTSTAVMRRKLSRANGLDSRLLWPATAATILLSVSIGLLIIVSYLLVRFPTTAGATFLAVAAGPPVTAVSLLTTLAVMTGVVEETAFRGYMQVPIEERLGPVVAVTVVAIVFALAHSPPWWVLPIFVIGAAGWSMLAWSLNSTVPGMIAHAVVDATFLLWVWRNPEGFRALLTRGVMESGSDPMFVAVAMSTTASVAVTCLAFIWVRRRRASLTPLPSAA